MTLPTCIAAALLMTAPLLHAQATTPARQPTAADTRADPTVPPEQRAAFDGLLQARGVFLDAHARETPAKSPAEIQRERSLTLDLAKSLDDIDGGVFPAYTPDQVAAADSTLNAAYRDAIARAAHCAAWPACTNAAEVQQAERAWLDYREVFVVYARLRWPAVPADAWRTRMAIERTAELKAIAAP
jgi:uncharacterized protein YecT (DUF1311 family)